MDKKTRSELITIIRKSLPGAIIASNIGVSFGENKKFYQKAREAAQNKKTTVDRNIHWVPFVKKEKTHLVCGIRSKEAASKEIDSLNTLYFEFKYRNFLEKQVEKLQDVKSTFVKKILLTDEIKTMEDAIYNGDIVGVNLRSPQAVILVEIPGFLRSVQEKCEYITKEKCTEKFRSECSSLIRAVDKGFKNYDENITVHLEGDIFVVLKWARGHINTLNTISFFKKKAKYIESIINKKTKLKADIGIGQYYPGLNGLKKSYNDAKTALEIGKKIFDDKNIHHIADIGLFVSLSKNVSFDRKCELAHQILGEIITDKELFRTVKTFLDCNMNLSEAAKKLRLHRNTLIYRLNRIKKEAGLDPRKFKDAVQIKLGLMLYSPLVTKCPINGKSCDKS